MHYDRHPRCEHGQLIAQELRTGPDHCGSCDKGKVLFRRKCGGAPCGTLSLGMCKNGFFLNTSRTCGQVPCNTSLAGADATRCCQSCASGGGRCYVKDDIAHKCTTCSRGKYAAVACSASADTVCTDCYSLGCELPGEPVDTNRGPSCPQYKSMLYKFVLLTRL